MSGKVVIRETLRAPLQNHTVKLSDHKDLLERVSKLEENYDKLWTIVKKLLPESKDETPEVIEVTDATEVTEVTEIVDNKVEVTEVTDRTVVPNVAGESVDDTIQQNVAEMKHQELDILGELRRQQLEDLDSVETSEESQPQPQPQPTSEPTSDPTTTVSTMTAVETVVLPDTPVTSPTKVEEMHDILDMIESSGQKDDHQKSDESSQVDKQNNLDHQVSDESSQKNNNVVSSHKEDKGDESPQKKSSDEEEVSEEEASESESSEEENNESGDESD